MAGSTEFPVMTRLRYYNVVFSIDTGPQQKFIGRSMGLMAVRAHHGYKIPLVIRVIKAAIVRIMCVRTRGPMVSATTDNLQPSITGADDLIPWEAVAICAYGVNVRCAGPVIIRPFVR